MKQGTRFSWQERSILAFCIIVSALSLVLLSSLTASSTNMQFMNDPILSAESCTIQVVNGGLLTQSPNGRFLSSQETGGQRGKTIVTSIKQSPSPTSRFEVSVDAPSSFDIFPTGGNDNVTFQTRMHGVSINRGITMNNRNGSNPRRLRRNGVSVTEVTIDLIAQKPNGQAFPNGSYRATTIIRCE